MRGEVGRVNRPASGHLYYDLKDDRSVIAAITWKGQAARLSVRPEEGMEVIVTGRMTTFPGQSKYQLIVEEVAPAGAGALMAMLEKRRAALAAEGLFDPAQEAHPYLQVIGVIFALGRGDPRHPAPPARPLSPPCADLAGGGAGRTLRARGGGRHPRLQRAGTGQAGAAATMC